MLELFHQDIFALLSRYLAHIVAYRFALLSIIDRYSFIGLPVKYWIDDHEFIVYRRGNRAYCRNYKYHRRGLYIDNRYISRWFYNFTYHQPESNMTIYTRSEQNKVSYVICDNRRCSIVTSFLQDDFEIIFSNDNYFSRSMIRIVENDRNILRKNRTVYCYHYGTQQLFYTICNYNLTIYYQYGAKFCDIDFNREFNGIKNMATFYYPSGVIIREYK